jgi:hypothetical protein
MQIAIRGVCPPSAFAPATVPKFSTPQVAKRPSLLPPRNQKRRDTAQAQGSLAPLKKMRGLTPGMSCMRSKNWTMVRPKPMSVTALRTHDISVRSRLIRVRGQAKWLSAVALTSNAFHGFWLSTQPSPPLVMRLVSSIGISSAFLCRGLPRAAWLSTHATASSSLANLLPCLTGWTRRINEVRSAAYTFQPSALAAIESS